MDFGSGAYECGVAGRRVIHSFSLDPLFASVDEPWHSGYDPADQLNATFGAQAQDADSER